VISFGWRYDFNGGGLKRVEDIPEFLLRLREAAGSTFGLDPAKLQQVLLTQYPPGAAIGWHKDRSVFGDVVGISLAAACTFRFRRKAGTGWERRSLVLAPRSAYLLQGASRTDWQHSIPAVEALRYSITFRSFRSA
jgi:alkylated DNA repair dioxygenase AlkB